MGFSIEQLRAIGFNIIGSVEEILERLKAEGYENCCLADGNQIIVNNRGEIDSLDGKQWTVWSRIGKQQVYHLPTEDMNRLFSYIEAEWPKYEPGDHVPILGYVGNRPIFKGDRLYVDIRGTCATEWGDGQIADSSANEGQGNVIIFEDGDYYLERSLVFAPTK